MGGPLNKMATFIMTGKYSSNAYKEMSKKRTSRAIETIAQFKGEVQSMYATLGANDLIFIINFPTNEDATKASVALSKLTGISFNTSPAMTVDDFDKLVEEL